jgi:hypothetical protein
LSIEKNIYFDPLMFFVAEIQDELIKRKDQGRRKKRVVLKKN